MSEQDGTQSSTKQRRSRKSSTVNQQNGKQALAVQRPVNDDAEAWKSYWETQGQSWRTEPEIDVDRQIFLSERRSITLDIEKGIYPFKGIKLTRADIEWLLASHDNGKGPVDWSDVSQHKRRGLDLRGADLRGQDLQSLPLSRMYGGLTVKEWDDATTEQREMASVHLEGARLGFVELEEASLRSAHFEGANLHWVHLDGASLHSAHFEGAGLRRASLRGAYLQKAYLHGSDFYATHMESANLTAAHLEGKLVSSGVLADMQQYDTNFPTILPPANLQLVFFDSETRLNGLILGDEEHGFVELADVRWGGVNLAVVDWGQVTTLGDEHVARQEKTGSRTEPINNYEKAVRSNRQLAISLQEQGLNELSTRFAFRAQLIQRKVFWYQRKLGKYLFSLFLDLLTGYGYKPLRSFIAYAVIISLFATIYFLLGSHLAWNEAIVISMTAFHGRGFFPEQFKPGDPQALVAAIEAFVGLLIEVTFIATLTQRLFGK